MFKFRKGTDKTAQGMPAASPPIPAVTSAGAGPESKDFTLRMIRQSQHHVAEKGEYVIAFEGSVVAAKTGAKVVAMTNTKVVALRGSIVIALPGSQVIALAGSKILFRAGASIKREKQAAMELIDDEPLIQPISETSERYVHCTEKFSSLVR